MRTGPRPAVESRSDPVRWVIRRGATPSSRLPPDTTRYQPDPLSAPRGAPALSALQILQLGDRRVLRRVVLDLSGIELRLVVLALVALSRRRCVALGLRVLVVLCRLVHVRLLP